MSRSLSPVQIGIIWQRLAGLMDEVAQTFVRIAFSSVIRENWDMACGLMDRRGRQFAQSSRSVPSFIGTMSRTARIMLETYPIDTLTPGDVLITNDSWLASGHLNDITMLQPIFRNGRAIGFVGSTFHSVDIGGAPSPHARDCFEEGLCIPVSRIMIGGQENRDMVNSLMANLRAPDETLGDIRAQFAAYDVAARRLIKILDEEGIDDLDTIVDEILNRSESSLRQAITALPDGTYEDELQADGLDEPLTIRAAVTIKGADIAIDFAGTSPQVERPINSVLAYTASWSAYAVKCALDPKVPNNDGTFRPIAVTAPEGSLLNPRRPAPVWARHLSGHYVPAVVLGALAKVVPMRVIADCGSPLWSVYFKGQTNTEKRPFVKMYFMTGGFGARPSSDGPSCLSFPSNISNAPIEQFEAAIPLMVTEKHLVPGSGGAGRHRGGLAQRISFKSVADEKVLMTIRHERVKFPPRGLLGGLSGSPGIDLVNGKPIPAQSQTFLQPGDVATFQTPGGGGISPPEQRDPAAIAQDIAEGYVVS